MASGKALRIPGNAQSRRISNPIFPGAPFTADAQPPMSRTIIVVTLRPQIPLGYGRWPQTLIGRTYATRPVRWRILKWLGMLQKRVNS
jgi:hypothetical protein